jgi:lysophospholipase L1-like esterase
MFRKNSSACFLGDSITAAGSWVYEIYDNFKKDGIKVFNCGRAGAGVEEMTRCIYEEAFIHCPDYIVIMLGMNDVCISAYAPSYKESDKKERIMTALTRYEANIRKLYAVCEDFGCEAILCSPTAYYNDETQIDPKRYENCDCNAGLSEMTKFLSAFAREKNCKFIDFHTPMTNLIGKELFTDLDRIHPNAHGHHIMAEIFLQAIGRKTEVDFSGEFEFKGALRELFDISDILRGIAYIERNLNIAEPLEKGLTVEARKDFARKRYELEENKELYVGRMFKIYYECIDYKSDYEKLYIKKMIDFLNS